MPRAASRTSRSCEAARSNDSAAFMSIASSAPRSLSIGARSDGRGSAAMDRRHLSFWLPLEQSVGGTPPLTPIRGSGACTSSEDPGLDALEDRGDALAATDAQRREPVVLLALRELGDEREREPCAGGAERMAERDRPSVHVRPLSLEAEVLLDGEILRREGLVDLDEVHVLDAQARAREGLTRRGRGADAHDVRVDSADAAGDDAGHRRETGLPRRRLAREHQCRGTVVDPARVARGHGPVLLEPRLEGRELLERRVRADVLVPVDDRRALLRLHLDGNDLLREATGLARLRRELVRAVGELVGRLAAAAVLSPEVLRGVRHAEPVVRVDERDPQVVLELVLAERQPPARAADDVRREAHVLAAAGEDEVGVAETYLVRAEEDRLQSRAA